MLIIAMNFIFAACILYTVAVWSEKLQGRLKRWHLMLFWLGLCFDTIGTGAMGIMAGSIIQYNFHGITGMTAIILMLFHSTWASIILYKKDEIKLLKFHKFSFVVWIIWLIPMITGMIYGSSM
jgi:uncharacterized repeat protein (TIGR03987 family)